MGIGKNKHYFIGNGSTTRAAWYNLVSSDSKQTTSARKNRSKCKGQVDTNFPGACGGLVGRVLDNTRLFDIFMASAEGDVY